MRSRRTGDGQSDRGERWDRAQATSGALIITSKRELTVPGGTTSLWDPKPKGCSTESVACGGVTKYASISKAERLILDV